MQGLRCQLRSWTCMRPQTRSHEKDLMRSFSAGGTNWAGHHCHCVCTNLFVHAYQSHQPGPCYDPQKMLQAYIVGLDISSVCRPPHSIDEGQTIVRSPDIRGLLYGPVNRTVSRS